MEPESSLLCLQVPVPCPYPEPAQSSQYPHLPRHKDPSLILPSHLCLGILSGLVPSGFPTKTMYKPLLPPIRATCPAHLILLDFITQKILGKQ